MAEYLSPGVYVEEVSAGPKSVEGVSTSTAGFLGETERGPTVPQFISSFREFQRVYGGYAWESMKSESYLPYAIEGFFANGGKRCWVARITGSGSNPASLTISDSLPSDSIESPDENKDSLTIKAIETGKWGNQIKIKIENATNQPNEKPGLFKLVVGYSENHDNIDIQNPEFINEINNNSKLIELNKGSGEPARPDNCKDQSLPGGDKNKQASLTLKNLTFKAIETGEWGNRIKIKIENATQSNENPSLFKLIVEYNENYDDLDLQKTECTEKINKESKLINMEQGNGEFARPHNCEDQLLRGGSDGGNIASLTLGKKIEPTSSGGGQNTSPDKQERVSKILFPKNLIIEAIGPGKWGNDIKIKIDKASEDSKENKLFKLIVKYKTVREEYDNLSIEESSFNYYKRRINGVSNFIIVEQSENPIELEECQYPKTDDQDLKGGSDGDAPAVGCYKGGGPTEDNEYGTGLTAFEAIDEISIVCAPNENDVSGLTDKIITHCETLQDRFAVLQITKGESDAALITRPKDSKYAAFYYPWLNIVDPVKGGLKTVPPGGHVVGLYARTDVERGVHKAPANEVVRNVAGLEYQITKANQDLLNPKGINCIRSFRERGIRVWGARTASSDPEWKYINVRRLFLYLEESIEEGCQWVVFEPNDQRLWARVRQTITNFLTRVWRDGALMGNSPEQAFFVKCDETTMMQDDIANGRLIVEIGVAPVKPAEFVIFRIQQATMLAA